MSGPVRYIHRLPKIPFLKRDQLSGTRIRDLIKSDEKWDNLVPSGTKHFLENLDAKNRLKIL